MTQVSRTFRIFVSSTFSDLKEERNALQKKVFPKLRELCMQHGCRFQAIDLRWGVREEATHDQQTMKICYEEIERCQRITPRPHFIVLLGDRYGWRPPPFEIPADEFAEIEQRVSDTDKELLKKWYRRDDNAVPPVYCLQPRKGEFTDYTKWEVVEGRLHSILLHAVAEMNLTADSYVKYFASATEQEIIQGLKATDAGEHVFGFFRSIKDLPHNPGAKDFIDLDETGNLDRDANRHLNDLTDRLRRLLPGNIYEYEAEWTGSGTTAEHIDRLCRDVYDSLSKIIQKEIAELEASDPLDKEIADHIASGKERAKFFIGRTGVLKTISEYVKGTDPHPFAVSGASGSGKSALMAHAAEKVRNEHKNAEFVVRFIGATPNSSDVRTLLESLCSQISRCYGADESKVPANYRDLIKDLPKRLALATAAKPLFLFLDALDQFSNTDNARNLIWLPAELPANVRLVVSTLPGECLSALKKKLPGANFTELEPMPSDESARLLDMWLDDAHRKLQEDQSVEILRKFEVNGMPLYLRLAFGEAQRWKSYDGLSWGAKGHAGLSEDIPGIIRDMFWRLSQESNHGRVLVERSLGYLAASRNGLTEDEMLDVLSQDNELYQDFLKRTYHKPPEQRLPVVIWSRLFFDLEPYVTERSADGTTLLAFYHRQLGEVVRKEYLAGEAEWDRHRGLAQYFADQPLWIEREDKRIPHLRKVSELPYQQTNGEMWTELEVTLTDLGFIEAKCTAGMTYDLVADYKASLTKATEKRAWSKGNPVNEFSTFVQRQAHILSKHASITFQLAANQSDNSVVAASARSLWNTGAERRPWIKCINKQQLAANNNSSIGYLAVWNGYLPITFSSAGEIAWMFNGRGGLIEVVTDTGEAHQLWDEVCPNCQMLELRCFSGSKQLTMVGEFGDCVVGNPDTGEIIHRSKLDIEGGRIAACKACSVGFLALISYPDHRPAKLYLFLQSSHGQVYPSTKISLNFGYKPRLSLAVLENSYQAVCPYGERIRDMALIDYHEGRILNIYTGNKMLIESCCVVEQKDLVISGSQADGVITFWRLSTSELLFTIQSGLRQVNDMLWCEKYRTLLAMGSGPGHETIITAWNLDNDGTPKTTVCSHHSAKLMAISPDKEILCSGDLRHTWGAGDDTIIIQPLKSLLPIETKKEATNVEYINAHHNSAVLEIHILPGGKQAISTSVFGEFWLWDIPSAKVVWRSKPPEVGFLFGSVISPDGKYIAVASLNSDVVWDNGKPQVKETKQVVLPYSISKELSSPMVLLAYKIDANNLMHSKLLDNLIGIAWGLFEKFVTEEGRLYDIPNDLKRTDGRTYTSFTFPQCNSRVFLSAKDALEVWDNDSDVPTAWMPMPNRVSCIAAVDLDYVLVGDSMGYVWHLKVISDHAESRKGMCNQIEKYLQKAIGCIRKNSFKRFNPWMR